MHTMAGIERGRRKVRNMHKEREKTTTNSQHILAKSTSILHCHEQKIDEYIFQKVQIARDGFLLSKYHAHFQKVSPLFQVI